MKKKIFFDAEIVNPLNLTPKTKEILTKIGLPEEAPPSLAFDSHHDYGGLKLIDLYKGIPETFSPYIWIGATSAGDLICINENNENIVFLNHEIEDNPKEIFINSSIVEFIEFLSIYENFIENIQKVNGGKAYIEGNAPNDMLEELKNKFLSIDNKALLDRTFWIYELKHYYI